MTPIPFISGEAAKTAARIAIWCLVLYAVVVGLQACGTSKTTSQSKFDAPKYDLHKRHKR